MGDGIVNLVSRVGIGQLNCLLRITLDLSAFFSVVQYLEARKHCSRCECRLHYLIHPMTAFGRQRWLADVRFWPLAAALGH